MIFHDVAWAELLSLANVGLGIFLAYLSYSRAKRLRGYGKASQILIGTIGLYWAAFYAFVFVVPSGMYDPIEIPRLFMRPAITLTLGFLASNALYHWRLGGRDK